MGQRGSPTLGSGLPTWSSSFGNEVEGRDGQEHCHHPTMGLGRAADGTRTSAQEGLSRSGGSRGHHWTCRAQPGTGCPATGPETKRKERPAWEVSQANWETLAPSKTERYLGYLEVSPKTPRTSCSLALGYSKSSNPGHSSVRQMDGGHKKDGKGNSIIYKKPGSCLEAAYQDGKSNNKEQDLKDGTGGGQAAELTASLKS